MFEMDAIEKYINTHKHRLLCSPRPQKNPIKVKPLENHTNKKTTGEILGYRELVNMYAPVCNNCRCNKIGRLSQGWGKMQELTQYSSFQKKYRRATYLRAVCDIRPKKIETQITRLIVGVNFIDYPGEVSTPTSDLTNMELHVNSAISDVISRYMCMGVKYFYLNN